MSEFCEKAALLRSVLGRSRTRNKLDVQIRQKLNGWIRRGSLAVVTHDESTVLASYICERLEIKISGDNFRSDTKYNFGERLGFRWNEVQFKIDTELMKSPRAGHSYHLSSRDTHELMSIYGGVYELIYRNPLTSKNNEQFIRSTMRVRYAVNISRSNSELREADDKASVVKCKMHMAKVDKPDFFYKYDGFLMKKAKFLYLYFENCTPGINDKDMCSITVRNTNTDRLLGMLSSVSTDLHCYASPVYMRKIDPLDDLDNIDHCKVIELMSSKLGLVDLDIHSDKDYISKFFEENKGNVVINDLNLP